MIRYLTLIAVAIYPGTVLSQQPAEEDQVEAQNKAFVLEAIQETLVKGNPDAVEKVGETRIVCVSLPCLFRRICVWSSVGVVIGEFRT